MEDDKSLSDYGLTSTVAKAQQPAEVALADGKDGDADDNQHYEAYGDDDDNDNNQHYEAYGDDGDSTNDIKDDFSRLVWHFVGRTALRDGRNLRKRHTGENETI